MTEKEIEKYGISFSKGHGLRKLLYDKNGNLTGSHILTPDELLTLLETSKKKAFQKGYWERDKDDKEEKEFSEAEEAHRIAEGYCCACGYDMAVMAEKIETSNREAVEGYIRMLLERIKHPIDCDAVKDAYREFTQSLEDNKLVKEDK